VDGDEPEEAANGHHAFPHDPAPPEPRRVVPAGDMLALGAGLAGLGLGLWAGAWAAARRGGWLLAPLVPVLGGLGVLAGWAAAIHLTGGEKFDDHPWV
jgi:hypothetical protein